MFRRSSPRYSGRLRPGRVSPRRPVPSHILRPDYAESGTPGRGPAGHVVWSVADQEKLRDASRIAREVLDCVASHVRPGATTEELDAVVHAEAIARGAYPSPLNYRGFPKSCATSVNEVICHGIPDDSVLEEGDIVNVDVTCFKDGFHGDLSEMFRVGAVDAKAHALVRTTYNAMMAAAAACGPGVPFWSIGQTVEAHVAHRGFSVVRAFCGAPVAVAWLAGLPWQPHVCAPADSRAWHWQDISLVPKHRALCQHD